jgi:hypothetical protein
VDLDGTKTMHGPVWAIPSPADIDESRRVDGADLIMLCAAMDSEPESDNWNEKADMNGNDIVDKDDLEIFYEYYGMVLSGK